MPDPLFELCEPLVHRPFDLRSRRAWLTWFVWLVLLAAVTAALLPLRPSLNEAHIALAYLLLVQFASARHGRALGLALAGLAFLCFDWFFLPPYSTLVVAKPIRALIHCTQVRCRYVLAARARAKRALRRLAAFG